MIKITEPQPEKKRTKKEIKDYEDKVIEFRIQRDFPSITILKKECRSCREHYPLISDYWPNDKEGNLLSKKGNCLRCHNRIIERRKGFRSVGCRKVSRRHTYSETHKYCANADCPKEQPRPLEEFYQKKSKNDPYPYRCSRCIDCKKILDKKKNEEIREAISEGKIPKKKCNRCGIKKEAMNFNVSGGCLRSVCKECFNKNRNSRRSKKGECNETS